jgi:cell division protein FtsQ
MKKFWRILKKVLLVSAMLSAAGLFVIVLTSAIQKQKMLVCRNIQVKIDYDSGIAFLSENEIKDKINYLSGGSIIGKRLSALDFRAMEREVKKNPYVKSTEIFVDQSQVVTVEISQKRPILRVINNDGVSYYIGENNDRIPVSDNFTSHVAVALGSVETHTNAKRDSSVQAALYNLIQYVKKDEFLNALVDQVYVEENGELMVIPKIEGQTIRFGLANNDMAEKFDRLKVFYKEGLRRTGWSKYKTIDVRYKDQVVCEKRDTTNKL